MAYPKELYTKIINEIDTNYATSIVVKKYEGEFFNFESFLKTMRSLGVKPGALVHLDGIEIDGDTEDESDASKDYLTGSIFCAAKNRSGLGEQNTDALQVAHDVRKIIQGMPITPNNVNDYSDDTLRCLDIGLEHVAPEGSVYTINFEYHTIVNIE